MGKGANAKVLSLGLVLAVLFFYAPHVLKAQVAGKGNLIGFIYGQDGTTPVAGAVVMVKNISNGRVFQSSKSDNLGVFKVQGLDTGLYALGVTAVAGDFNSGELVGVAANETSKIAIAISPYEKDVREAVRQVIIDQKEKGESRIGHVVDFYSGNREADVFIERGLLQSDDRIHVKGESTDFYQDSQSLKIQGAGVRKILAGQNGMVSLIKTAVSGDVVYVCCKKGILPFFLAPLGIAAVITGSAVLTPTGEEVTASTFKPK
jgi:hypothetical protein